MSHATPKSIARLTHLLELAVAAGVLAALAVPAFLFPAIRNNGPGWESNAADALEAPPAETYATGAVARSRFRQDVKDVPNVTEHFAIQAIERLSDRFEFSCRMVTARPHVTDADVEELVDFAMMGNVEPTRQPNIELVYWDWLVHVEAVSLSESQVTDATLGHLAKLTNVEDLLLCNTQITDEGVRRLANLPNLKYLILSDTKITDASMSLLAGCRQLELLDLESTNVTDRGARDLADARSLLILNLSHTQITNEALASISKLDRLEDLSLEDCVIDDKAMRYLGHMGGLQYLALDNTGLTNEGLEPLFDLQQLVDLSIVGTKVDARGRTLLRAALPDCEVGD